MVLLRFLSLSDWSPNTFLNVIRFFSFESMSNVIAAFATSYVALHIMIKAKDKSYFYKDQASISNCVFTYIHYLRCTVITIGTTVPGFDNEYPEKSQGPSLLTEISQTSMNIKTYISTYIKRVVNANS